MVMTREEIMAMPTGPDLDRLVAEALGEDTPTLTEHDWADVDYLDNACPIQSCRRCGEMQYTCSCRRTQFVLPDCTPHIACYSTDICAAWKAWEAIPQLRTINGDPECPIQLMRAWHWDGWQVGHYVGYGDTEFLATAPTVPLAICRAFLIWKVEEANANET